MTFKFDGWPRKTIRHLLCTTPSLVHHFKSIGEFKLQLQPRTPNLGQNWQFSVLCDLEIWWMILTKNRAPLLCYLKLYKSFQSHWWIQTRLTVRRRSTPLKIRYIFSLVTLKFDGEPWKIIGHLFYATSICMHHFIAICEFKLKIQSGTRPGSKSTIFFSAMWPWNLTDDLENQ